MAEVGDYVIERRRPTIVTSGSEWIGMLIVIVLAVIAILIIYLYLKPQLFKSKGYQPSGPPNFAVTCPTSDPPINLTAAVVDHALPSFDASWDPVFLTTTAGASVLGYNIYVSTSPGINSTNTKSAGFTPIPQVRVKNTGSGRLVFGTKYYFRVSTVDTCGSGALSSEEHMIQI